MADYSLDLESKSTYKEIGEYVRQARALINAPDRPDGYGRPILEENTRLADATVRRLFDLACQSVDVPRDELRIAIVATGGYGRRELAPYSDIDVTFIPEREEDEAVNAVIKSMFQSVMDVFLYGAGVKVGYAFRLFTDLGQLDHQTQTTLLDARLVAGDRDLFDGFKKAFRETFLVVHFLFQKSAERDQVLAKHGGENVYQVEPNIKEGPGGLRDAQIVEWYSEVLFGVERDEAIAKLVEHGFIRPVQVDLFKRSYEFLFRARTALHASWQEARDLMTTEKQEVVAAMLGYVDRDEKPAVEQFMADYYDSTAAIRKITKKVMGRCLDCELDLRVGGLASLGRAIVIADQEAAAKDPAMPLHACELAQAYEMKMTEEFDLAFEDWTRLYPEPERQDICGRVFTRILASPRGVSQTIRRLADYGILGWLIPEFAPLRNLIPYDAAHEFTVGEHSIRVVECLDKLRYQPDARFAEYGRVWAEVSRPEILYMAGLIHDIGKQWPGSSHGGSGADAAQAIATRLGWDAEMTGKLATVVRHHLLMAETSRLRDLRLDETIRDFTRVINDQDTLNMLFVLTCADTHAVGEGIWTEMKGRFLSELYGRVTAVLQAASEAGTTQEAVFNFVPDLAKHRERIQRQLSHQNLPQEAIHELTARMPAQYLLNTPLEEMYLHMAMFNRLRSTGLPTVDFKTEFGSDYTEMTIVAYDDPTPGLLAKIVGVLYALDCNIHGAQVFTRASTVHIALDTLWIDYRGKPLSPSKRAEVQETLRQVLTGKMPLQALFEKRKKPHKQQVIHGARIDEETSDRYSLLEVRAPDEPGVLYRLCAALSRLEWNIHSARVSVFGSRVRAAFYITTTGGGKVPAGDVERLLSTLPREEFKARRPAPHARV